MADQREESAAGQHRHVQHRGAGEEEHHDPDQRDRDERAQIRLGHEQKSDPADHHRKRQQSEREPPDVAPLRREPGCQVDDDRQLGELRGLERRQPAELQPTARAVLLVTNPRNRHKRERHHGHDHQQHRCSPPQPIVQQGEANERDRSDPKTDQLTHQEVVGIAIEPLRRGDRRRVHEDQADEGQRDHPADQQPVGRARGRPQVGDRRETPTDHMRSSHAGRLRRHLNASTSRRKCSPRASKLG